MNSEDAKLLRMTEDCFTPVSEDRAKGGQFAKGGGRVPAGGGGSASDAAFKEKYSQERPTGGTGDCHETAVNIMMNLSDAEAGNYRLVQGVPTGQGAIEGQRFDHAWVERTDQMPSVTPGFTRTEVTVIDRSNGNNIELPRALYYKIGKMTESDVTRYTRDEMMVKLLEEGNYGPWT